ncbi:DoxX family protein [Paraglaciecola sp. L1A13]|uniref:DoxX family protein n=1 Tax=Paraglaciecola sp. L1A13 TaxID=2686359 RepID=UPI00131BCC7B|nr:DoxX family protein [Paraglaciecola sp. L1A13]|tara:strand:+ start:2459 stop:2866 length:408 start_codon:yes stop_codon:yes gene_type:complete
MNIFETACLLGGRLLLGLYFILPGLQKIVSFDAMSQYMAQHNVPVVTPLLVLTIVLQLSAGLAIIVGFKGRIAAFILAGLTLVISVFMHNFWNLPEGGNVAHETQNFVKNMAIMAGLLILSARGTGPFSLDNRTK